MAEVRTTACLVLALLLASAPCAFAQSQQESDPATQSAAEEEESNPAEQATEPSQQTPPTAPTPPAATAPAATAQPGLPPGALAPTGVAPGMVAPGTVAPAGTAAPGLAPGAVSPATTMPAGVAPATVPGATAPDVAVPGTMAPAGAAPALAPGTAVPAPYVPKTEFDNTPHRFNMTQDGKQMSANDFDAWMRAKGYRVARGAPPGECPNAPPAGVETIVGPDGCPVEVSIELDGVTFEFAKSTLRPEAKKTLDQAIEILKRHPELTVEVAGHTDSRGDAAFNQKLSQVRAKAVYDYMIENGIAASQLEGPIGYGESKPIASNDTDAGREENRRTELNIKAVAALPAPATTPPTSADASPAAATVAGAADGPVVAPAATPDAASGSVDTDGEDVAQPAAPAASAASDEASAQPASGAIETTAAGHVLVPADGGTTATGHVIRPAATTGAVAQPAALPTDPQTEVPDEDEAGTEADAPDDDR